MSDAKSAIDPQTGTAGDPKTGDRFAVGPEGAHNRLDGKDARTHANAIADAANAEKKEREQEEAAAHVDPTAAAKAHGNEPSRGAKKDNEIMLDEEEELKKKDEAKEQSKEAHKHRSH